MQVVIPSVDSVWCVSWKRLGWGIGDYTFRLRGGPSGENELTGPLTAWLTELASKWVLQFSVGFAKSKASSKIFSKLLSC